MVKMFPEPLDRLRFIIVGVKPLPLFQVEGSLGHLLKGIGFLLDWFSFFLRLWFLLFLLFSGCFLASCFGAFSFFSFLLSPFPENSANFLASNSAILVQRSTCSSTALALGWFTTVVNHLLTLVKGFLKAGSSTCL